MNHGRRRFGAFLDSLALVGFWGVFLAQNQEKCYIVSFIAQRMIRFCGNAYNKQVS